MPLVREPPQYPGGGALNSNILSVAGGGESILVFLHTYINLVHLAAPAINILLPRGEGRLQKLTRHLDLVLILIYMDDNHALLCW